jgi:hypothetical protein
MYMLVFCPFINYNELINFGETMTSQKTEKHYSHDVRLALLEQSIDIIKNTLIRLEERIDNIKYPSTKKIHYENE